MTRARAGALLAIALAVGCGGPELDGDVPDAPAATPSPEAASATRARRAADADRELQRLLPIDRARVLWYRATLWDESGQELAERPVGLFSARAAGALEGLALVSIGLGDPGDPAAGLRLWRAGGALWMGAADGSGVAFRACMPDATWDDAPSQDELRQLERRAWFGEEGAFEAEVRQRVQHDGRPLGRRVGIERLRVLDVERSALRVEHGREAESLARLWLAQDVGLAKLELVRAGKPVLRLVLEAIVPRGPPREPYDQGSPNALWRSLVLATRRCDVEGLERLMTPRLRARAERPLDHDRWRLEETEVQDGQARPDDEVDRVADAVRAEIGLLVTMDLRLRRVWEVTERPDPATAGETPDPASTRVAEARAPAIMVAWRDGASSGARVEVVLARSADGPWRWADLREDPR